MPLLLNGACGFVLCHEGGRGLSREVECKQIHHVSVVCCEAFICSMIMF